MERRIVIIPTYNEKENIEAITRKVFSLPIGFHTLQRHAPRHDQPDVAGAEDHDFPAGNIALHIDHALRCARRVNACRPSSRNSCTSWSAVASRDSERPT